MNENGKRVVYETLYHIYNFVLTIIRPELRSVNFAKVTASILTTKSTGIIRFKSLLILCFLFFLGLLGKVLFLSRGVWDYRLFSRLPARWTHFTVFVCVLEGLD